MTAEAVRQARQTIRRLKRERPDARIVVTGCAAQTEPRDLRRHAGGRVACSATRRSSARELWRAHRDVLARAPFGLGRDEKVAVNDIMAVTETAAHLIDGLEGRARAFVQVQNGCDHRCTFCIIPYGRGNSRSVPMGEVVAQVRRLVERGYREVVLTGVDITSYGANLPGAPKLGTLVKQILQARAGARSGCGCRRSTRSRPTATCSTRFANEPRLMPHLHLSLQAGDDLILKRMKRRHLRADAIAFCEQVRRLRPDVVFGADIIAGFPTETEEMFARSLDLVDECGLTHLHVFPFSPRPGTPAARMPQVARDDRQGARPAPAREGRGGAAPSSRRARSARRGACSTESRRHRPHRAFHAGAARRAGRAGRDRRSRHRRPRRPAAARGVTAMW